MSVGETSGIEKALVAEEAIDRYLIVKFGADDDKIVKGAGDADKLIGVVQGKAAAGERVNVMLSGVSLVKAGGNITRGDMLTADGAGRATATTTAKKRLVGMAVASGAEDDLIPVLVLPAVL